MRLQIDSNSLYFVQLNPNSATKGGNIKSANSLTLNFAMKLCFGGKSCIGMSAITDMMLLRSRLLLEDLTAIICSTDVRNVYSLVDVMVRWVCFVVSFGCSTQAQLELTQKQDDN